MSKKPKQKSGKLKKVKDITMEQYCSCMNDKRGSFQIEKLPFEVNGDDYRASAILIKVLKCMEINLDFTVKIVDFLKVSPNIIIPENIHIAWLQPGSTQRRNNYYTSLFGHVLLLMHSNRFYREEKNTINERQRKIIKNLLCRGGKFDSFGSCQKEVTGCCTPQESLDMQAYNLLRWSTDEVIYDRLKFREVLPKLYGKLIDFETYKKLNACKSNEKNKRFIDDIDKLLIEHNESRKNQW